MKSIFLSKYRAWIKKTLGMLCCLFFSIGCVEEFNSKSIAFEEFLVVEGVLTDELKNHVFRLSKSAPLNDGNFLPETGARITIEETSGITYSFSEMDSGTYFSDDIFAAEPNSSYLLRIETLDGEVYVSDNRKITGIGQVDEVSARRVVNENGTDGVEILASSSANGTGSFFFRYEWEETYQVIAPFATSRLDLIITSENPPMLEVVPKIQEERVCYASNSSNTIILASTSNLSEPRITNQAVHFIANDNPILRFRYSILVRQFIQSREGQTFFETLAETSESDNLFSQTQPGFVEGNISPTNDMDKRVLGFFEVASVSTKRIFFEFRDIFSDINFPPFYEDCRFETFAIPVVGERFEDLKELLDEGYRLLEIGENFFGERSSYRIVSPACGNCNVFGTNVEPEFWEEG